LLIDVLANDSDPDLSDTLTITSVTQGANGGLVSIGSGAVSYDPNGQFDSLLLGESAVDTFTYTADDGSGGVATTSVTITVTGIADGNLSPVAGDDVLLATEDAPVLFGGAGLLANDSDPDGDPLVIVAISQPSNGVLTDHGDGTFTYAPTADYNGADSFTYDVFDGRGGYATATVNVNVDPVNDAPVAVDDSIDAFEDTPLVISVASLLANDGDVEGDALNLTILTAPTSGSLVDNGNGTWTYTPDAGFIGTDSFTYQALDATLASNAATVSITVTDSVAGTYTYGVTQPLTIADNGFVVSTIDVVESFAILDINVELNITHTRVSDLRLVLVSPDGTPIELIDRIGGSGGSFNGTLLDDDGATLIDDGAAPFTGVYRPSGDLSLLEGLNVQGTWTLEIYDEKRHETGTLDSWSIIVTRGTSLHAAAAPAQVVEASFDLDQQQLDQAVAGLIEGDGLAGLPPVRFQVAQLEGLTLGLATADRIYVDRDAAGHGWFVDRAFDRADEYVIPFGRDGLTARADSLASGRIDLTTVLRHEIGHLLGRSHDESGEDRLMFATLATGTRLGETVAEELPVEHTFRLHAAYASFDLLGDRGLPANLSRGDEGDLTHSFAGLAGHGLAGDGEPWWIVAVD
jgi:VCBS repeat-containing protein